jgi:hypothetical protein
MMPPGPWLNLPPQRIEGRRQGEGDHVDRADAVHTVQVFVGHTDGEVGKSVAIEIAGGHRVAEVVPALRKIRHTVRILIEADPEV